MKTNKITGLALLTAIVIVLQVIPALIPIGIFNITLALVPIVVGAAIYGWRAGAWLGFVFGTVVLLTNSSAFLAISISGTIATVLIKGILAGLCAGVIYQLFNKKEHENDSAQRSKPANIVNDVPHQKNAVGAHRIWLGTITAGIAAPVINTGVFLIGCKLFFMEQINEWAAAAGYADAGKYMIIGFVGINFVIEMLVNIVLSSVIVRIIEYKRHSR